MKFTILGSTGFIGQKLVAVLTERGHEVETPARALSDIGGRNLGHVIYAIGLTGNFRTQPEATIEAHVTVLQKLIKNADYESWLYLSSTRVYGGLEKDIIASEDSPLKITPGADSLYDLSKLLGESVCLGIRNDAVRVARLSNVYGIGQSENTFLGSVLRDLNDKNAVTISESPLSSKDYISIEDVIEILPRIAVMGKNRLYNVASGKPVTHQQLADFIRRQGWEANFTPDGQTRIFPVINTRRIEDEFNIKPASLLDDLSTLLHKDNSQPRTKKL